MKFRDLFKSKAQQRFWHRVPDDHVLTGLNATPIVKDDMYFVVRLTQMYTRDARVLWQKYHPMLHALIDHYGDETHAIIGPQQLQGFGGGDGTKFASFNQRLVGPKPYRGGDVVILTGLYSVPGENYAALVLSTLSTLSGMVGSLNMVEQVAKMIGETVSGVLQLTTTQLHVGIYDALKGPNEIKPGYYVGMDRRDDADLLQSIWIQDGRLMKGRDAGNLAHFDDTDFMVIELEPREHFEEWRKLSEMMRYEAEFNAILATTQSVEEKRVALNNVFSKFRSYLVTEEALTTTDRKLIQASMLTSLKERLEETDPFGIAPPPPGSAPTPRGMTERKSATGTGALGFDLLDVRMVSPEQMSMSQEAVL